MRCVALQQLHARSQALAAHCRQPAPLRARPRTLCAAGAGDSARESLQRSFEAPASMASEKSVLGGVLALCCASPKTGFFRDGFCCTGPEDFGRHVVCAEVTDAFLQYSKAQGNDLMTPRPEYSFPGLKPGNRWCLCASRWAEALKAGCAPPVVLSACAEASLKYVTLEQLQAHALPE